MRQIVIVFILQFAYLCAMNITHKYQLRGMYEKEKIFILNQFVEGFVDALYDDILMEAKLGNNLHEFTILCYERRGRKCIDHYKQFKREFQREIGSDLLTLYNIGEQELISNITEKIKEAFPDSNLTKHYRNCCDYYILSW